MAEITSIRETNGDGVADIFAVQERRIEALKEELREKNEAKEPASLEDILNRLEPDSDYKSVYQLRTIKTKDTKKLIGMLRKVQNDERIEKAASTMDTGIIAREAFGVLLDELEEEILPFMADIAQVEDLDEEPASAPFDILNDLMNAPAFLDVLRSASRFVWMGRKLFGYS